MRENAFYSIRSVDILIDYRNGIKRYKYSIHITNKGLVSKMEPRMNESVSESLSVKFTNFKVFRVLSSKGFEHPCECWFIRTNHIVSNLFELTIWFQSRMLQKIAINSCYLMRLTDLHGNIVVTPYSRFYTISSIDHSKVRIRIFSLSQCLKKCLIIFCRFLKYVFGCENISRYSILCYENSPLRMCAFLSKERGIENENRRGIRWEIRVEANRPPFLDEKISSSLRCIVCILCPVSCASSARVCFLME